MVPSMLVALYRLQSEFIILYFLVVFWEHILYACMVHMFTYVQVCPNDPGPLSLLPDKMQEALGGASGAVGGWDLPPEDEQAAPPPYMARGVLNRGAHKSLKQSQVQLLQKEIDHPGG